MTRCIAIIPAFTIIFIDNVDGFTESLNILQAIVLPFALVPLLRFAKSEYFTNLYLKLMITLFRGLLGTFKSQTWKITVYIALAAQICLINFYLLSKVLVSAILNALHSPLIELGVLYL